MFLKKLLIISSGIYLPRRAQRLVVLCLLVVTTLACVTNTPVARISTPRPTRTPLPTFTVTPIPPTATPVPTDTPTPIPTDTPIPTATPLPPTDTPLPTDTPQPTQPPPPPPTQAPPPPPTDTPVPAPAPAPANTSPVATPTNPPEPGTPPGRYEVSSTDEDTDCANIGVRGRVREKGSDTPVQYVTIEVTGKNDKYKGPFIGKTDKDGKYGIFIGALDDDFDGVEFKAKVIGDGVESEDDPNWEFSSDCDNGIQIYEINWDRKN